MKDLFPPLDGIVDKYPLDKTFKGELKATLRPMKEADHQALFNFFKAVPENERLFIKHQVQDPDVIKRWCEKLDLE